MLNQVELNRKNGVTTLCIQQLSPTHCDCRSTWRFSWEGGRWQICQQQVEEDGMHELSIGHELSRCQLGDSSIAKIIPQNQTQHYKVTVQALSLTASYHFFLCKDEPTFLEPPYLLPPLVTKKAIEYT